MIGQEIKLMRIARKKTQVKLAKESGISKTFMSLIENNHKDPSIKVLKRICENINAELRILLKL